MKTIERRFRWPGQIAAKASVNAIAMARQTPAQTGPRTRRNEMMKRKITAKNPTAVAIVASLR